MPRRTSLASLELSPIEREIFEHIVHHARNNYEVAEELDSTHRTVKFHVANLMKKAGVSSREQLILRYWRERLDALKPAAGTSARRAKPRTRARSGR